jgi:acetolactate synthase-1/2/3 large subunit
VDDALRQDPRKRQEIIQIDDREDAFGWFARITVGLEADAKAAVVALLDKLKEGGKPGRQPDAALVQKKQQQKPPAITYDDGKSVDPRRAARYLEDKLPKRDRILVFDGGHCADGAVQTITSSGADNWSTGADFGAVGQGLGIALGACFARPGKRITHVTADASFMMNVPISTPRSVTICRSPCSCSTTMPSDKSATTSSTKASRTKYAEIASAGFRKLAVGFGAKGFRVNRPDDFGEIDKALAVQDGPVIVNIRINGDVELPVSWEIAQALENTGE